MSQHPKKGVFGGMLDDVSRHSTRRMGLSSRGRVVDNRHGIFARIRWDVRDVIVITGLSTWKLDFLQKCIDSDGSTMNPHEKSAHALYFTSIGEVYVIEENGHRTLMPEGSCFGRSDFSAQCFLDYKFRKA